jgi:hypothetical protein
MLTNAAAIAGPLSSTIATLSLPPIPFALSAPNVSRASLRSARYVSGAPPGVLRAVAPGAPASRSSSTVVGELLMSTILWLVRNLKRGSA